MKKPFAASLAPRLVLILAWIFGRRWDRVWQGNWIVPLLGIIALPYTTIMYMLVWSPTGLHGFDWVWLVLGIFLDFMKWSQIARNREGIPGSNLEHNHPLQQLSRQRPLANPSSRRNWSNWLIFATKESSLKRNSRPRKNS